MGVFLFTDKKIPPGLILWGEGSVKASLHGHERLHRWPPVIHLSDSPFSLCGGQVAVGLVVPHVVGPVAMSPSALWLPGPIPKSP